MAASKNRLKKVTNARDDKYVKVRIRDYINNLAPGTGILKDLCPGIPVWEYFITTGDGLKKLDQVDKEVGSSIAAIGGLSLEQRGLPETLAYLKAIAILSAESRAFRTHLIALRGTHVHLECESMEDMIIVRGTSPKNM